MHVKRTDMALVPAAVKDLLQICPPVQPLPSSQHLQLRVLLCYLCDDDGKHVHFEPHAIGTDGNGRFGPFAQSAVDACAAAMGDLPHYAWLSLVKHQTLLLIVSSPLLLSLGQSLIPLLAAKEG
jgi:hypothetical protein